MVLCRLAEKPCKGFLKKKKKKKKNKKSRPNSKSMFQPQSHSPPPFSLQLHHFRSLMGFLRCIFPPSNDCNFPAGAGWWGWEWEEKLLATQLMVTIKVYFFIFFFFLSGTKTCLRLNRTAVTDQHRLAGKPVSEAASAALAARLECIQILF